LAKTLNENLFKCAIPLGNYRFSAVGTIIADAGLRRSWTRRSKRRSWTPPMTRRWRWRKRVRAKCCAARSPNSSDHREIIDLVYYHEKSIDEAAQIIGIPAATVKTRMFYARQEVG
jgi:DNA-directed RNA polymerase specialized sigma24 family protein